MLHAMSKGVFTFSSFRIKEEMMIFSIKHRWPRKHFFVWSGNPKQTKSISIVHWLLALMDFFNTNSHSFCPFTKVSQNIHSATYFHVVDYPEWTAWLTTLVKIGSEQEISSFGQVLTGKQQSDLYWSWNFL